METSLKSQDDVSSNKSHWHPAFLLAVQLELIDYRDSLEFKYEYQLTSEPLRIDLLIIKKPKEIAIDKNIARIFRADNLLEYKSPTDYLSVNDFLKVYAYANLYAAINPGVDLGGITITFVESRYPRKLLHYLTRVRGYMVEETSPGIYHVSGDYIPIQIVESKKLSVYENLWLSSLTNGLKAGSIRAILQQGKKHVQDFNINTYLDVIYRANPKAFMEADKMWIDAVVEHLTETGVIPELVEQGREQEREQSRKIIAQNLLNMGIPIEQIAQATELPVENIRSLA